MLIFVHLKNTDSNYWEPIGNKGCIQSVYINSAENKHGKRVFALLKMNIYWYHNYFLG